ncbi:MAG TPA: TetR family transcriptional regulator [Pseudomonas sp.]
MARRKKEDSLETRERILDAAEWCFCTYGVSQSTLALIAEKAECTRGAIYWHFPKEAEVLKLVLDRGRLSLQRRLASLTHAQPPLMPKLQVCLDDYLAEVSRNRHVRSTLKILLLRCDYVGLRQAFVGRRYVEALEIYGPLVDLLARAHAAGEMAPELDPRNGAELLQCLLIGGLRKWLIDSMDGDESSPRDILSLALGLLRVR